MHSPQPHPSHVTHRPLPYESPRARPYAPSPYSRAPSPSPYLSVVLHPAPSTPACGNTTRLPLHLHLYPEDFSPQPSKQRYALVQLQELANALPDAKLWAPLLDVASELHLHLHPVDAHLESCKERWHTLPAPAPGTTGST